MISKLWQPRANSLRLLTVSHLYKCAPTLISLFLFFPAPVIRWIMPLPSFGNTFFGGGKTRPGASQTQGSRALGLGIRRSKRHKYDVTQGWWWYLNIYCDNARVYLFGSSSIHYGKTLGMGADFIVGNSFEITSRASVCYTRSSRGWKSNYVTAKPAIRYATFTF